MIPGCPMMNELKGVLPIVHTPFNEQDEIDWENFEVPEEDHSEEEN